MPEFAKLLKDAKELSQMITQHFTNTQSCPNFFTAIVLNGTIGDAAIISTVASCLDAQNDKSLLAFIEKLKKVKEIPLQDFEEFKRKVLIGIYILKWCRYNPLLASWVGNPLIARFKKDLGVEAPKEIDVLLVDGSLNALSEFFSYVHENKSTLVFLAELNQCVGAMIQIDIHDMRRSLFAKNSSWLSVSEKTNTYGMK